MTIQQLMQVEALTAMVHAIDPDSRVDLNDRETSTYEVRVAGRHVGFMRVGETGALRWI